MKTKSVVLGSLVLAVTAHLGNAQTNTHRYFHALYSGATSTQSLVCAVSFQGTSQITNNLNSVPVANRTVTGTVSAVTNTANTFTFSSDCSGTAGNTYESALLEDDEESIVSPYGGITLPSTNTTYEEIVETMHSIQGAVWLPPLPDPALPSIGCASTQKCAVAHLGMPQAFVLNDTEISRIFETDYVTTLTDRTVTNGLQMDTIAYVIDADDSIYVGTNGVTVSGETNAVLRFIQSFHVGGTLVIDGDGILRDRDETCITEFSLSDRPSISDAWGPDTGTSWKTRYESTLLP